MDLNNKKDIHILGAGPAGVTAAYYANKNNISFSMYERSNRVGGNAQTFRIDDFLIDSGAHRFHDKYQDITLEVKEIMKDELKEVHAPSKIYWNDRFIDFPISMLNVIKNIDLKTNIKIIKENLILHLVKHKKPDNFKEFAYSSYGKTLSELFLIGYSEKLWGEDAEKLSLDISGGRLNNLNLASILKEILFKSKEAKHLDGSFLYPKYGFGTIFTKIYDQLNPTDILFNSSVSHLNIKNNSIESIIVNNKEVSVRNVISTLPLSVLIDSISDNIPPDVCRAINRVKYRSLKLVILFINKESFTSNASLYFPDKNLPFTRIYEPKNRSKYMAPDSQTCIVTEIPVDERDNVTKDKHKEDQLNIERVKSFLLNKGFIKSDQIIGCKLVDMPYAYPILDINSSKNISSVFRYLSTIKNLHLIGRSAEFKYLHVHDLFRKSKNKIYEIKNIL